MKKIYCVTNLDLWNEQWPVELPEIPQVGDEIESMTLHRGTGTYNLRLSLEVVKVRWRFRNNQYVPEIELHIRSAHRKMSLNEWFEWYAPLVGKTKSYFI